MAFSDHKVRTALELSIKCSVMCLATALLLVACSTTNASKTIGAFSKATTEAITSTQAAFDLVERNHHEVNVAKLVDQSDNPDWNPDVSLTQFVSPDALEGRRKVLIGLQTYAQKLNDIMKDDRLKEFDQSSKALGEELIQLNKNKAFKSPIPESDIKIFATAVDAVGNWFIQYKREKAVKEIVSEMNPHVKTICDLFIQDIGQKPGGESKSGHGLRLQLRNDYNQRLMY